MPRSDPSGGIGRRPFPGPAQLLFVLAGYFALQVVVRCLTSSSVDLDESEQVLFSQRLSWGYGPDPPLYTWMQMGLFAVFGPGVFALALLKDLLLLGTYLLTYRNARLITGSHTCGAAAALSLLLIPTIAWESQRDLTHSVLASTMAALLLCGFLLMQERRRTVGYVLFGLAAGAGLLAKFNFAFWILGLLGAALLHPRLRKAVLDWRILLALLLCGVMVAPYGLWMLEHRDAAFGNVAKLAVGEQSWLKTVLVGLRNLVMAVISVLGPLVLVFLAVLWDSRRRERLSERAELYSRLVLRAVMLILLGLLVLILAFRATGFRERWFQPLLVSVPVAAIALLSNRLEDRHLKRLAFVGFAVMGVVLAVVPGRIRFGERLGREEPLMRPYAEVGAQLRAGLPPESVVVADTALTGGNLCLALPSHEVLTPQLATVFKPRSENCVLIWDARKQDEMPKTLRDWAETVRPGAVEKGARHFFAATYYHHTTKQLRLGVMVLE